MGSKVVEAEDGSSPQIFQKSRGANVVWFLDHIGSCGAPLNTTRGVVSLTKKSVDKVDQMDNFRELTNHDGRLKISQRL